MRFKLKIIKYWIELWFTTNFSTREKLLKHQERGLASFAKLTLSKSSFYQKYFQGDRFEWDKVPEMNKQKFMQSFDDINTQGIVLEEAMSLALKAEQTRDFKSEINGITVGLSTGTSGKRGVFLVSEDERAKWVAMVMSRIVKPIFFKKQKAAFFLRANSNLYSSVESNLFEFKYFDIFNPIQALLKEVDDFQPNILAAQPSILIDIAKAQQEKQINIKPYQVISFAEVLDEGDKTIIENIFGVTIKEVYQCTEGLLGVSCQYGTMHLNEDVIHFDKEWIDEDKFYPIVTDFTRHSQPVVKYKMNDILQIKKTPCPCGSNRLAIDKIMGRNDDVLIFDDKKIYPDVLCRKIALATDDFLKYQIVQTAPNELEVGITCPSNVWEENKQKFRTVILEFAKSLGIGDIHLSFVHNPNKEQGSKNRKIRRQ